MIEGTESLVGAQDESTASEEQKSFLRRWWLTIVSIIVVFILAVIWILSSGGMTEYKNMGYPGAFLVSFLAGATIIIPIPGSPAVFALGGVLIPWVLGPVAGFGEALGEFTGYFAGRGGHQALRGRFAGRYDRIESLVKGRWGMFTIFAASSTLNPFFDLFGFAAGAVRVPWWKFFLVCWAGKTIKNIALAYAGMWGMGYLLRWAGVEV